MSDPVLEIGAAPETHRLNFIALLFGACAAPLVWLGQLMLAYGVSAEVCYPGDHPVPASGTALRGTLIGFDALAVIVALAGALTAFWCLGRAQWKKDQMPRDVLQISEGRARVMALWGIFSSLCFLIGILFNIIASVTVPICAH